ncbi:glycosyltransferase family 4 protein [Geodermatophilus amargosae]|uniref:glycosyltransferase family 4 protein n=1 Tax=Geodermatophilus amargosae TaxID=1296565 RepID=UPI0034DFF8D4
MTGSEWFSTTPGGLNRYFTDLFGALRDLPGVTVSASAFGAPPPGGTSWGPVGGPTWRRALAASTERRPAREPHVLDRHFCLYGRPAAGARRANPLVVHFHGPWAAESRMAGSRGAAVKYGLERLRYARADRYVVLSRHFGDLLVDTYRVPEHRVRVIPPGVDLRRFGVVPAPEGPPTVLCVRRLERRMGIDVLLDAWPAVRAAHPEARLVVVGTGSEEASLRERAARPDIAGTARLTGAVDDETLGRLYTGAVVTVVPSVALEGFGLIALESLAAGRAAVVTDCGGLPDAVRGLDPSLVVRPGDGPALAARIDRALRGDVPDPQRCRAHAETFSWRAAAHEHAELYRELL